MTRRIGRSADEYSDDDVAQIVLDLVTELVEDHRLAKTIQGEGQPPEPDRVRAYCPPECRYDFEGVA